MPGNSHTRRAALLLAMVILIGLLHLLTPGHDLFFHDTYRRLSYFPIVLGGLWFGLRGGLILALLSSIAFTPHLLLYLGRPLESYLSELTEILLYIGAGTLTGFIAGREKKTREQYRLTSEKLEQSYTRLHRQTQELLTAEEHLAEAQKISALGQLSASLAHEIKTLWPRSGERPRSCAMISPRATPNTNLWRSWPKKVTGCTGPWMRFSVLHAPRQKAETIENHW